MTENSIYRWLIVAVLVLALIGLLAYVRGDDSDSGRSPEREDSLSALIPVWDVAGV